MPNPPTMFHLTPSTIARYFFQDCERYLRYRCAPRTKRESCGISERQFDYSPLMRAVLAAGSLWEREVVEKLLAGRVAASPPRSIQWGYRRCRSISTRGRRRRRARYP
jgi:hypothetical protein